jgi:hypothetical protein
LPKRLQPEQTHADPAATAPLRDGAGLHEQANVSRVERIPSHALTAPY